MAYIVIIGIIIVIIMVITSTKIKKSAAAAFESEIVEKDDFRIEKAEGFLYPIREKPDFPFEAYSKLYGERSTRNIWQARIRLRISDGLNLQKLIKEIKKSDEKFISQKNFDDVPEGQKGTIIRTEKTENEVDYKVLRKIVQSKKQGKTYELKTTILEPFGGEYTNKACEMMESFEVK
ncbi:MAG: hypothetical protein ACR2J3_06235 [Aridibacter sp.]